MMEGSSGSFPNLRGNQGHQGNAGPGGDMQKLLEGIQFSRLTIENDRKDFENKRSEIEALSEKMKTVSRQVATKANGLREKEERHSIRSTEFSHLDIRDKVTEESLAKVDEELRNGWDELVATRKKAMDLTGLYLKESCAFAEMWNCSELGRKNRESLRAKQLEDMRRIKHRMEYDLQDFLVKLNRVNEANQEMMDLEKQFRGQEASIQAREKEAYKRLKEIDELLDQLWKTQDAATRECEDEVNRLQLKIQQARGSISHWERRVSENQRTVEHQRSQISNGREPSGIANRFISYQQNRNENLNGFNTDVSNNKSARIYQPVKPTPKVIQPPQGPKPSTMTVAKKPIFQNPPTVSVKANIQHNTNYSSNGRFPDEDDGSSTQNSSCRSDNYVSLPSASFFPNKPSSSSSGRVFQFKKKSMDGSMKSPSDMIISGPTQRSVTVSLGNTPYSTFQNGRAVLQQQQRNHPNQNDLPNDQF